MIMKPGQNGALTPLTDLDAQYRSGGNGGRGIYTLDPEPAPKATPKLAVHKGDLSKLTPVGKIAVGAALGLAALGGLAWAATGGSSSRRSRQQQAPEFTSWSVPEPR